MATTFLYNPDRKSKDQLIAEFVVRTEIYDEIMHDLETSHMQHPEQHYLLVGQRGAGKTTLLNRLKYGIEDSKNLKEKVIPILFSEEQYNISELVNLWESIGQHLDDYYNFKGLSEEIESHLGKKNFEELTYEVLEKYLKNRGKKLVLLIDNIGDLLRKMDKTEVHRFREILQSKSEIRLIVGSPFYLETILDYHQPFFEFFKVVRLDSLGQKETQNLLLKLAQLNGEKEKIERIIIETPERVETLRTLTGGVPRTIALMFNIFIDYNNEDTVKDLEKILDAVTPLYKHRMDDLPTQQQKIVDAVAKNWDGISVKELKEKLRLDSKVVYAQLRQLEKNQVIEIVETNTKNHLYFLKERFFNIWYLMRYGRKYDKQRVIWLVKFLESWCTANELEQRIVDYVNKINEGKLDKDLISFYGEVYTAMNTLKSELKIILKESTPDHLSKRILVEDKEVFRIAKEKFENNELEKAFKLFNNIISPDETTSKEVAKMSTDLVYRERNLFLDHLNNLLKTKFSEMNDQDQVELSYYEQMIIIILSHYACIDDLYKGNFKDADDGLDTLFNLMEKNSIKESTMDWIIQLTFMNFLLFDQPNIVLDKFEKVPQLKDKLKPTYYAVMKLVENESQVQKMGPELVGEVDRILQNVERGKEKIKEIRKKVK